MFSFQYWFEVFHGFRIPVVDEDEREKYEEFLKTKLNKNELDFVSF